MGKELCLDNQPKLWLSDPQICMSYMCWPSGRSQKDSKLYSNLLSFPCYWIKRDMKITTQTGILEACGRWDLFCTCFCHSSTLKRKTGKTYSSQKTSHSVSRAGIEHIPTSNVSGSTNFFSKGINMSTHFSAPDMLTSNLRPSNSSGNRRWLVRTKLRTDEEDSQSEANPSMSTLVAIVALQGTRF